MLRVMFILLLLFIKPVYGISDNELFIENEKNTISIFNQNAKSIVNVSNIQRIRRGFFDRSGVEVPAGAGTGFVWDNLGNIVTNFHVIQEGGKILISFHGDKTQYEADVIGVEPKKDIAVLKLRTKPKNLRPVKVGVSKTLKVGQKAMAIGNPFGLDHTITSGIISALNRKIEGVGEVKIHGMIQTDASINPGNSGGPLLNSQGEVIGMNTIIFSKSGMSAGVGFAVPVDSISRIVPQLIKYGKVIRPGLGIELLPDYLKRQFGLNKGIMIARVNSSSPASSAGLQGISQDRRGNIDPGDIIIKIDTISVNNFDDIYHVLDKKKIGESVKISYIRNGKMKTTSLKLIAL